MNIHKGYKTKLRPTKAQRRYFIGCAGAARFVYNWGLADRIEVYETSGESVSKFEQKRRFNSIKDEICPWIREYPYVIMQEAFDHLDDAYRNFFRRIRQGGEAPGFPKFKNRHRHNSFSLRGAIKVERDRIKLPKIGWVNLAERGYIPTSDVQLLKATVSQHADEWYISVQVIQEVDDPPAPTGQAIGIDIGVRNLVTTSIGYTHPNPKLLPELQKKRACLQREFHRRQQGSKNQQKTRKKLAKLEKAIADARSHAQHVASKSVLASNPRRIAVEDTHYRELLQDSEYAFWSSDAAMGETRRRVEYKAEWKGIEVVRAPRDYAPNKRCSDCGVHNENTTQPSKRYYKCESCGATIRRNENSACNLAHFARTYRTV